MQAVSATIQRRYDPISGVCILCCSVSLLFFAHTILFKFFVESSLRIAFVTLIAFESVLSHF